MNAVGALGGGFPMSSSASRSIVPATLGSRTQMSSLVSFVAVIAVLVAGRSLLAEIPRAALAAVVVAAAFAVIDIAGFASLWKVSRTEAALAAVTCLAILTVDLLFGVLVAIVLSGLVMLQRVARPHDAILGQGGEGLDGWIDVRDQRAHIQHGLLVYRFDAPLFFANADEYAKRLIAAFEQNPGDETHVILDFEGIGSLDTTAAERLEQLHDQLSQDQLTIAVARANDDVIGVMERSGLIDAMAANTPPHHQRRGRRFPSPVQLIRLPAARWEPRRWPDQRSSSPGLVGYGPTMSPSQIVSQFMTAVDSV